MEYNARYDSPLGPITLAFLDGILTGLSFGADNSTDTIPSMDSVRHWLDLYFTGKQPDFLPPVRLHGTDFQRRVWQALTEIPYGHTISYGELARRVGCRSAQAVGQAVGSNPIAIIIPCHRVIGSNGSLTGYAYGLDRKKYLLALESKPLALLPPPPRDSGVAWWPS